MVTDASLDFGTGGFGLSEFVIIVKNAGHMVTTAHRNGSGPNLTIAGSFNFATAATAVKTANYDQIWLFGFSTTALTAPEQTAIAQFMQSGGGVFATGDHESIGAGGCQYCTRAHHAQLVNYSDGQPESPRYCA
jgi:hypothetical protein